MLTLFAQLIHLEWHHCFNSWLCQSAVPTHCCRTTACLFNSRANPFPGLKQFITNTCQYFSDGFRPCLFSIQLWARNRFVIRYFDKCLRCHGHEGVHLFQRTLCFVSVRVSNGFIYIPHCVFASQFKTELQLNPTLQVDAVTSNEVWRGGFGGGGGWRNCTSLSISSF